MENGKGELMYDGRGWSIEKWKGGVMYDGMGTSMENRKGESLFCESILEGNGVWKMERGELMYDGRGCSIEKWKGGVMLYMWKEMEYRKMEGGE